MTSTEHVLPRGLSRVEGRPPSYVSREIGAAELAISCDTWDAMVKAGTLPQPVRIGTAGTTPRWRWADVDAALAAQIETAKDEPKAFIREVELWREKERRGLNCLKASKS